MELTPAILIIAHDAGCGICATGQCDCRPERTVLRVGDESGLMVAAVWTMRLKQFQQGLRPQGR